MFEVILNIVAKIGGILFLIKTLIDLICPELLAWYYKRKEIKLSAHIDKKVYVSKAKFDREFEMYQELTEKNLSLVYKIGEITLRVKLGRTDKDYDQILEEVAELDSDAEFCNKKYGAFISEDLFEQYKDLYKECYKFERMFGAWSGNLDNNVIFDDVYMTPNDLKEAFIAQQKVVSKKSDKALQDLRMYIQSLECE